MGTWNCEENAEDIKRSVFTIPRGIEHDVKYFFWTFWILCHCKTYENHVNYLFSLVYPWGNDGKLSSYRSTIEEAALCLCGLLGSWTRNCWFLIIFDIYDFLWLSQSCHFWREIWEEPVMSLPTNIVTNWMVVDFFIVPKVVAGDSWKWYLFWHDLPLPVSFGMINVFTHCWW